MPTTGMPSGKGTRAPGIRVRVRRTSLNDRYLIIPNDLVRGEGVYSGLSPHERIYLAAGLSYSNDFDTTREDLDGCIGDLGRDKREAVRRRLREAGFLTLTRISDGLSFIWGFEFHMEPLPPEERDELTAKKAAPAKKLPVELRKKENPQVSPCPDRPGLGLSRENANGVDLTEALAAQALGGQGDVYKEEKNHSSIKEPPPPTPTTDSADVDAEKAAGAAEDPELEEQMSVCVEQIAADRPEWSKRRIVGAVRQALADGRDPRIVLAAARLVAADPQTRVPGRLNEEGDWWSRAARVVHRPVVEPEQRLVRCDRCGLKAPEGVECPRCTEEARNGAPEASEGSAEAAESFAKGLAKMPPAARARLLAGGVRS